jgi:hypothetical protein
MIFHGNIVTPEAKKESRREVRELAAVELRFNAKLPRDFITTREIGSAREFVGQERALAALELGLGVGGSGYNIFVSGLTGTDKLETLRRWIVARAAAATTPGEQGVLMPAANVRHLVLRSDVIQAVADERFHLYPVRTIDEGIAILAGMPADGEPPAPSVNGAVKQRVRELAAGLKEFAVATHNGAGEPKP